MTIKFQCPCCDEKTLPEESGNTYNICDLCGWEDCEMGLLITNEAIGPNKISLDKARDLVKKGGFTAAKRLNRSQ